MQGCNTAAAAADDLPAYRAHEREQRRVADLFGLIPGSGATALDVGARDGYLSRMLAKRFDQVVALDLTPPSIAHPRIVCVQADVTALPFGDDHFDVVLCAEVLEHVAPAGLARACRELARVARRSIVIGVPYRQDLRFGRTTCQGCGRPNPPWGHVNAFDEQRLQRLFTPLPVGSLSYVGATREATNAWSAALMDFAGNPYGTYEQLEPCIHCGAALARPARRTFLQKVATKIAFALTRIQRGVAPERANWVHVRFDKQVPPSPPTGRP